MDEREHIVYCPICGAEERVILHVEPTFFGMFEDLPGFSSAKVHCPGCGFRMSETGETVEEAEEKLLKRLGGLRNGNVWRNLLADVSGCHSDHDIITWLQGLNSL